MNLILNKLIIFAVICALEFANGKATQKRGLSATQLWDCAAEKAHSTQRTHTFSMVNKCIQRCIRFGYDKHCTLFIIQ